MPFKQNPFSLYDFLGYFIPGAVFVSSVCGWAILESSMYPGSVNHSISTTPKTLVTFLQDLHWFATFIFIVASYIFGFAMSLASGIFVEGYLILRKDYPSKYRFRDYSKRAGKPQFFIGEFREKIDFAICVIVAPVMLFDYIFGRHFKLENSYYKKFKDGERDVAEATVRKIFHKIGLVGPKNLLLSNYNWHKYIYHYVYENSTNHATKIQNYVALYGFSRTVSMVFIVVFWTSIIAFFSGFANYSWTSFLFHLLLFSVLAYAFFLGFTKFYRRYTDEIFMAAIAMMAEPIHSDGTPNPSD